MNFIQIILQNSSLKEAKLYNAAQKAAGDPEIGITIQNKAAYHVIKDCANITLNYLPHLVFGSYNNPFESLKGKFKKEDIIEFVKLAETHISLNQLLYVIISKAEKMNVVQTQLIPSKPQYFDTGIGHSDDPYGEYGFEQTNPNITESHSTLTPQDILCKAFGVP